MQFDKVWMILGAAPRANPHHRLLPESTSCVMASTPTMLTLSSMSLSHGTQKNLDLA